MLRSKPPCLYKSAERLVEEQLEAVIPVDLYQGKIDHCPRHTKVTLPAVLVIQISVSLHLLPEPNDDPR
jgi:hypothetical protein